MLRSILPRYTTSLFGNLLVPDNVNDIRSYIESNDRIKRQLSVLSKRNLGFDLTEYESAFGIYAFVRSNPYYTRIDLTGDGSQPGLYCRINYRKSGYVPIYLDMIGKDVDKNILWSTKGEIQENSYLTLFDLPSKFRMLDINIYGPDKSLTDYYTNMTFIQTISINMNIKEKDVIYKDSKGESHIGAKDSSEKFTVGKKPKKSKELMGSSDTYSYKRFEDSLDFIFLDGDKDHKEENKEKARTIIERIINTASEECYIVDPYFGDNEFIDYITPVKLQNIPIKIISSTKHLKQIDKQIYEKGVKTLKTREKIRYKINELSRDNISNVECRLMKGDDPISHDRFIVSDNNVWIIGCSLNQLGNRAAVIARVPQGYAPKIIKQIKSWWCDNNFLEDL